MFYLPINDFKVCYAIGGESASMPTKMQNVNTHTITSLHFVAKKCIWFLVFNQKAIQQIQNNELFHTGMFSGVSCPCGLHSLWSKLAKWNNHQESFNIKQSCYNLVNIDI